jgi:hypothetical protein
VEPAAKFNTPCTRVIKESRLPLAGQTHEITKIDGSNVFLISQQSEGVLLKVKIHDRKTVEQSGFVIGSSDSGIHGLAKSKVFPGYVWVTLEFVNQVFLVDPRIGLIETPPRIMQVIDLPSPARGPHYIGEYGDDLWVSLKASNHVLRISHRNTSDYTVYPCDANPIFIAEHPTVPEIYYANNDQSSQIFRINTTSGETQLIPVPKEQGKTPVGLISGPLGIWFVLLGNSTVGTGTFARINGDGSFDYFKLNSTLGADASLLHLAFDDRSIASNGMWLLASSIVNPNALDMLIRVQFDENWSKIVSEEILTIPTQRAKAHRIYVDSGTVYVTELAQSRIASFSLERSAPSSWWASNSC